jgi:tRNA dimethylallyltransferase
MARLVVIVGPTASGKTELAIRLAERANGEIVSADSQQVYRGMDIGTGKATAAERARVPHHLLDVVDPDEPMTAARYVSLADAAAADILARGRTVVMAGGTGLYLRAFLYGLFEGPAADEELRARLAEEAARIGVPALWDRLASVDPSAASKIDRNDLIRITRALEVFELTGVPISEHQRRHDFTKLPRRHDATIIGLSPPRAELVARIDERVEAMFAAGLVDEVRALEAAGYPCSLRAFAAIGYREVCAHLRGEIALPQCVAAVKKATRRYARRQMVWFRSDPTIVWYERATAVDVGPLADWLRGVTEQEG